MDPADNTTDSTALLWDQLERLVDAVARHRSLYRRAAGLTGAEWSVLARLGTARPATAASLAAELGVPIEVVGHIAAGLVTSGYVARGTDAAGRPTFVRTPSASAELRLHRQLLASVAEPALRPIDTNVAVIATALEAAAVQLDRFREDLTTAQPPARAS